MHDGNSAQTVESGSGLECPGDLPCRYGGGVVNRPPFAATVARFRQETPRPCELPYEAVIKAPARSRERKFRSGPAAPRREAVQTLQSSSAAYLARAECWNSCGR